MVGSHATHVTCARVLEHSCCVLVWTRAAWWRAAGDSRRNARSLPAWYDTTHDGTTSMAAAAGMGGPTSVSDVIGEHLLKALEAAEEKLDEDLHKMEHIEEDDIERLRRQRLEQLKRVQSEKQKWLAQGHGEYRDCLDQKQFFEDLKKEARAVVHFYRPSTRRCEVVDKHLSLLCKKHIETKFMRVNAEKSPFICERLHIWALPTIVIVKEGKTDHSIVGFDEFGGSDDFSTEVMERVLFAHEALLESFM
ncbi:hypothetical protein EON62_01440 [archaeon]|nr:MAG: hypothetical protein EON62_01440 [archaeon]